MSEWRHFHGKDRGRIAFQEFSIITAFTTPGNARGNITGRSPALWGTT